MQEFFVEQLLPRTTPRAQVIFADRESLRLEIPAGDKGSYRLAQMDDYHQMARNKFPWRAPVHLELKARASSNDIPGTWGFGLWNDPFGVGLFNGGQLAKLPVLPNTAWFFFASPPNYLSLRDDLPAQGSLAATIKSPNWPEVASLAALPLLPFSAIRPLARRLRQLGRRWVQQSAISISIDRTEWHSYKIGWYMDRVEFTVDEVPVVMTDVTPNCKLAMVLWVDNQYASFPADGHLGWGTLANPEPAWIEIKNLIIQALKK